MPELNVDKETLRMAILLTIKKNVDALFKSAQEQPDLRMAAQLYRDIGSEMERGADQLEKLEEEKE